MKLYPIIFIFLAVYLISCSNQPISYEEYTAEYHSDVSEEKLKENERYYKLLYHKEINPDNVFPEDFCKTNKIYFRGLKNLRCIELIEGKKSTKKLAKAFNIFPKNELLELELPLIVDNDFYKFVQKNEKYDQYSDSGSVRILELDYWDRHIKKENKEFASLAFLNLDCHPYNPHKWGKNSMAAPDMTDYHCMYRRPFDNESIRISISFSIEHDSDSTTARDSALIIDRIKDEKINFYKILELYYAENQDSVIYKSSSYFKPKNYKVSPYFDAQGWKPYIIHDGEKNNYSLVRKDSINADLVYSHSILVEHMGAYPDYIDYTPPEFRDEFE